MSRAVRVAKLDAPYRSWNNDNRPVPVDPEAKPPGLSAPGEPSAELGEGQDVAIGIGEPGDAFAARSSPYA
jgi:hypothetical protein